MQFTFTLKFSKQTIDILEHQSSPSPTLFQLGNKYFPTGDMQHQLRQLPDSESRSSLAGPWQGGPSLPPPAAGMAAAAATMPAVEAALCLLEDSAQPPPSLPLSDVFNSKMSLVAWNDVCFLRGPQIRTLRQQMSISLHYLARVQQCGIMHNVSENSLTLFQTIIYNSMHKTETGKKRVSEGLNNINN